MNFYDFKDVEVTGTLTSDDIRMAWERLRLEPQITAFITLKNGSTLSFPIDQTTIETDHNGNVTYKHYFNAPANTFIMRPETYHSLRFEDAMRRADQKRAIKSGKRRRRRRMARR